MSFLFDKTLKTSLNLDDIIAIKDDSTGKIVNARVSLLFGQLLNLESLGQSCIEYPETTSTDCDTGEEVVLPLQLSEVLLKNEEVICELIGQLTNFNENCGGNPDISIPVNIILGDCNSIGEFNENQTVLYVSRKPLELIPNGLVLLDNDILYTDELLTTPYDGLSSSFLSLDIFGNVNSFNIDSSGIISNINTCSIGEFITITTSSNEINWSSSLLTLNSSVINWDLTGGITNNISDNSPTFNLSSNNSIVTMDLNNPEDVESIVVTDKIIDSINVSKALNLKTLFLTRTSNITEIDVSTNLDLVSLSLENNQLTELDISTNLDLEFINVGLNELTELDVRTKSKLETLLCGTNQLTEIDVSNNLELNNFSIVNNQLTEIDVSMNTKLTILSLKNNDISSIDITNNTLLANLKVSNTLIDSNNTDTIISILDSNGLSNGVLEIPNNRTSSSDTNIANLQAKGWSVLEI